MPAPGVVSEGVIWGEGMRMRDLNGWLTSTVAPCGSFAARPSRLERPWSGRETSQRRQEQQKTGRNRIILALGMRVPRVTWCRGTGSSPGWALWR